MIEPKADDTQDMASRYWTYSPQISPERTLQTPNGPDATTAPVHPVVCNMLAAAAAGVGAATLAPPNMARAARVRANFLNGLFMPFPLFGVTLG
jgi:hypothetical protein